MFKNMRSRCWQRNQLGTTLQQIPADTISSVVAERCCEKQGFRIKAVYPECLADHLIHGRFFIHHGKGFIPDQIGIQLRIGAFVSWDSLASKAGCRLGIGKEDFFLSQRNIKILRLLFFWKSQDPEIQLAGTVSSAAGRVHWPRRY